MRFCEYNKCPHTVFGTDKKTGKGYCKNHQFARTDLDKRSIIQKAISKNEKAKVRSLMGTDENKEIAIQNVDLNQWYKRQRKYMTGKCCNCDKPSSKDNEKYWRWSICHVFPKNIFYSVSTNDENWIELCIECHTLFDSNLETASEMKCFPLAVQKFYLFQDKIIEHHKYLDLFIEYSNQL